MKKVFKLTSKVNEQDFQFGMIRVIVNIINRFVI